MTKKFSREYLVEELKLPWAAEEYHAADIGEWGPEYEIVFQDKDGKYYRTLCNFGVSNYLCIRPWEHDKEIECTEVEKKLVTGTQWVPVE